MTLAPISVISCAIGPNVMRIYPSRQLDEVRSVPLDSTGPTGSPGDPLFGPSPLRLSPKPERQLSSRIGDPPPRDALPIASKQGTCLPSCDGNQAG